MPSPRLFKDVLACLLLGTCLSAAPPAVGDGKAAQTSDWRPMALVINPSLWLAACSVTPLPPVDDDEALAFENGASPDTGNLVSAMAGALEKFQQLVISVGGSFELKSAYRPPVYQAHLQAVWSKWMLELRNNREPGCQTLRGQVGEEFERHRLMETQKPATSSDHTRGLAFDAAVVVPRLAWLRKHRVSLDRLALISGIRRPDIRRDPVHFELAIDRVRGSGISPRAPQRASLSVRRREMSR